MKPNIPDTTNKQSRFSFASFFPQFLQGPHHPVFPYSSHPPPPLDFSQNVCLLSPSFWSVSLTTRFNPNLFSVFLRICLNMDIFRSVSLSKLFQFTEIEIPRMHLERDRRGNTIPRWVAILVVMHDVGRWRKSVSKCCQSWPKSWLLCCTVKIDNVIPWLLHKG